ncbi:GFA family protein [Devosia algicola]|uniref:GFA family protein n=1 Tax=Devosia algicola TaxID=3026418 RepID=A0ABY7YP20_9HYPH|nr:GFA family protein [Devosia algicola]WDR02815.1 GFA family protein [Devosia algicola]
MDQPVSGGCQCGAIRYRFTQPPSHAHICHCRMCQKAFGSFYAPLVGGLKTTFEFTRGTLSVFKSSDQVERGFCAACGTPLTLGDIGGKYISVSIGSLDHPEDFPPVDQHGTESRLSYTNGLGSLPEQPTTEMQDPAGTARILASNHQHPDYDTASWPQQK